MKAAVRQEYADSNQVKVNDDGKFNNDVAGTRGVYQAVMCHGLFIELIADIKKTNRKG
ncbi:TPA: autotransporter outer membrane beta-barrel domain-containing protein [Escherichia coli]|nr:autotransporter outer membrane beta-barrel domain-containing protein [Escherichia coli]